MNDTLHGSTVFKTTKQTDCRGALHMHYSEFFRNRAMRGCSQCGDWGGGLSGELCSSPGVPAWCLRAISP